MNKSMIENYSSLPIEMIIMVTVINNLASIIIINV